MRLPCGLWQRIFLPSLVLVPVSLSAVYGFFLRGLKSCETQQCLPLTIKNHPDLIPATQSVPAFFAAIYRNTISSLPSLIFGIISLLSVIQTLRHLKNPEFPTKKHEFCFSRSWRFFFFSWLSFMNFYSSASPAERLGLRRFSSCLLSFVLQSRWSPRQEQLKFFRSEHCF